jgi:hypothetical protein
VQQRIAGGSRGTPLDKGNTPASAAPWKFVHETCDALAGMTSGRFFWGVFVDSLGIAGGADGGGRWGSIYLNVCLCVTSLLTFVEIIVE